MTTRAALVVAAVLLGLSSAHAQPMTVRLTAPNAAVAPGGAVEVRVVADFTGVAGVSLASLTVRVTFDPARLALQGVDAGTLGSLTSASPQPGVAALSLFSAQGATATFTAATLRFVARAEGVTSLAATVQSAGDEQGRSVAARVTPGPSLVICVAAGADLWGDVDGDGGVGVLDAQQIARFAVGLGVADGARVARLGDVSDDGAVDIVDAQLVARFAAGLTTTGRAGQSVGPACAPPLVTQTVTTALAADVPASLSRQIERVYSSVDAVAPISGARLQVPEDERGTLVIALDAGGKPLLAAFADPARATSLGATSTAVALARIAMGPPATTGMTAAAIDAAVSAAPSFPRLESLIRGHVTAARAPVDDPTLGTVATTVASEVVAQLAKPRATTGPSVVDAAERSRALAGKTYVTKLPHYVVSSLLFGESVWIDDVAGPGVNLFNNSRLDWAATSRAIDGAEIERVTLPLMPFDLWSFLPLFNTTPSITPILGNSTRFTITIEQDRTTRGKHVAELIRQSSLITLDLLGVAKKSDLARCSAHIVKTLMNDKLSDALNLQSGEAVVAYIRKALPTAVEDPKYLYDLLKNCVGGLPDLPKVSDVIGKFSKAAGTLAKAAESVEQIGKLGEFGYQFVKYFGASYTVTVCKENGRVAVCPDTIVVTPSRGVVPKGGTLALSAKVLGADGSDMTAKLPVSWSSSDPSLATVEPATGVVIAAQRDGVVSMRATAAGMLTTVQVVVGDSPGVVGEFRLRTAWGESAFPVRLLRGGLDSTEYLTGGTLSLKSDSTFTLHGFIDRRPKSGGAGIPADEIQDGRWRVVRDYRGVEILITCTTRTRMLNFPLPPATYSCPDDAMVLGRVTNGEYEVQGLRVVSYRPSNTAPDRMEFWVWER